MRIVLKINNNSLYTRAEIIKMQNRIMEKILDVCNRE
jgi:hypothetical protein